MKRGWIPVDKALRHHLPKDGRQYSLVEAYISFRIDLDEEAPWTINGYAKLWGWDRKRVRRFTSELGTGTGQFRDTVGTPLGHSISNIFLGLDEGRDTVGTPLGQGRDMIGDTTTKTNTKTITPVSFSTFWSAYPRKAKKPSAERAWKKIKPDERLVRQIMTALEWQKESGQWKKDGGQYIPYPATWLNDRQWEDESANSRVAMASPSGRHHEALNLIGEEVPA